MISIRRAGAPSSRRWFRPLLDKFRGTRNCSCVRTICFLLVCAMSRARLGLGQGVGAVPSSDPVYRLIDRLDAAGILDTMLRGQRPYSRREVVRLLATARLASASADLQRTHSLRNALTPIEQTFRDSTWSAVEQISVIGTSTNETPRFVPADVGIGEVDAAISPLAVR